MRVGYYNFLDRDIIPSLQERGTPNIWVPLPTLCLLSAQGPHIIRRALQGHVVRLTGVSPLVENINSQKHQN